jgi:hypothetical protein
MYLRILLIFLIVFLIVRAFVIAGSSDEQPKNKPGDSNLKGKANRSGVPKGIGEYVDYEEVDKQK